MLRLIQSDVKRSGNTLTFKVTVLDDNGNPQQNPIDVSISPTINRTTIQAALKTALEGNDYMLVALSIDDFLAALV